MLKNKKVRVIVASITLIFVLGITVFAKQATETISVMYDNIKILIDGTEYTAKDANGNVIEPFIYNGTTYLPVRGIANAFNKEVDWEPQTSTVVLGSKNYDWLDQMGYANYETSANGNTLTAWETDKTGIDKVKYERGIKFRLGYGIDDTFSGVGAKENNDGTLSSYQDVEYLLNNQYKSFKGKFVCTQGEQSAIIRIYGDNNLLYTSPTLTYGAQTIDFDINISDCKVIKISASIPNLYKDIYGYSLIGIVNARFEK